MGIPIIYFYRWYVPNNDMSTYQLWEIAYELESWGNKCFSRQVYGSKKMIAERIPRQ